MQREKNRMYVFFVGLELIKNIFKSWSFKTGWILADTYVKNEAQTIFYELIDKFEPTIVPFLLYCIIDVSYRQSYCYIFFFSLLIINVVFYFRSYAEDD